MRFDHEEIARLTRAGVSAPQIATRLGCTTRTVTRVRAELGLTQSMPANACRPISAARLARAQELLDDGASFTEVGRTLGVSFGTLRKHFPGRQWSADEVRDF